VLLFLGPKALEILPPERLLAAMFRLGLRPPLDRSGRLWAVAPIPAEEDL
jgi:hypothetical protein